MSVQSALHYIDTYWEKLIRHQPNDEKTLIGLPHPYLVPSDSEMFQEMYYWDSYFMALGLFGTRYEELIAATVENMAWLFQRFGVIPNASRYYFLSRSQPPFFSALLRTAYHSKKQHDAEAATEFLRRLLPVAVEEYQTVWLGSAQPHQRLVHAGLSRYFDINYLDLLAACESGWDHSPRCEGRWLDHLPVDLNCILHEVEMNLYYLHHQLQEDQLASQWLERANRRAQTINRLMWDESAGFYFDYDYKHERRTLYPSLAGFYPLWTGIASKQQAQRIVQHWLPKFEQAGGLVTTLEAKAGCQWAYPNGWAPLQWVVCSGLDAFGFQAEANRIRARWCHTCLQMFEQTGSFWEKYNVVDPQQAVAGGSYGQISGFGWSNAIFKQWVNLPRVSQLMQQIR